TKIEQPSWRRKRFDLLANGPAYGLGKSRLRPAAGFAVISFKSRSGQTFMCGDDRHQRARKIIYMDHRKAAIGIGRQGDKAQLCGFEQVKKLAVAGAIDRRWPDDRPVKTAGCDNLFCLRSEEHTSELQSREKLVCR